MIVLGSDELLDVPQDWPVVESEVLARGNIVDFIQEKAEFAREDLLDV